MRKIQFLGIILLLVSCDQDYCSDYKISNKIGASIDVRVFPNNNSLNSITIESQNNKLFFGNCNLGGFSNSNSGLIRHTDSIQLLSNNEVVKTYFSVEEFLEGKSIYKVDDPESWSLVKNDKFYRIYEFVITIEDLD